ncbi:hypothetical protein GUK30_32955 [Rhizobium leguminosarum]|uniref:hypothetical protein n=1 Tax=Rhizobium TaxID=379 RepID=UPI0013BD1EC2|nr:MULTISPECIES: hypothetical protein [Rhizobium]NEI24157.1 hypothetical protein [Rhizobium ruizarguesonis]NEI66557.1 hypothetical protein [Rhizobium leguminosarum]
MILRKLEKNWSKIAKIGIEAEERGRPLGLRPSWADAPEESDYGVHQPIDVRRQAVSDFRKAK